MVSVGRPTGLPHTLGEPGLALASISLIGMPDEGELPEAGRKNTKMLRRHVPDGAIVEADLRERQLIQHAGNVHHRQRLA